MTRLLQLAAIPWHGHRLSDQHLATALGVDHEVLYVDPARTLLHPMVRERGRGLESVAPGVRHGVVGAPPGTRRRGVWPVTVRLERAQLRSLARRAGPVDAVLTMSPLRTAVDVAGDVPSAYVVKDDPAAQARLVGQPPARILAGHERLLARADVVLTPSPSLARRLTATRPDVVLLPHGVDPAMQARVAAAVPDALGLPGPVVGYVGGLTERVSWPHLEAVADTGCSLLLVGDAGLRGDSGPVERLAARPNVVWAGARAYEELPALLAAIDVGIVPYVLDEFNQASFPLKLFEYLAAGAPVVTTPLEAAAWIDSDLVTLVREPGDFAAAVTAELARAPTRADAARLHAAEHTWGRRADHVASLLGLA